MSHLPSSAIEAHGPAMVSNKDTLNEDESELGIK
jgi:hypothetical protein